MKSDGELHQIIKKGIESYKQKNIEVGDKNYTLHIYQEEPRANLYEGFLFIITKDEQEVKRVKKLDPYKEGRAYCPRIIIIEDRNRKSLLIRDALKNRHIIKTIKKINKTFLNKLKKALSEPKEENFNKLFDRTDVIEEFYILYKNTREYLLKNIHGIPEEEEREEFVDNFMMQMLTLWYLQEREFFHKDKNYFITKFKELKQKKLFNGFKDYYEFLTYFFDKVKNNIDNQYYEDKVVGKVVVIGPAVFLNGEHSKVISIPDKCFYKENITDVLIKTPPKKVSDEVPLLNLFESRDWTEGNIDEFVLGAIYEKLITYMERKKLGAYYTPPQITEYICKNTIEPFLVDRVNEEFKKNFESIDQIIESNNKDMLFHIFKQLKEIKILDPAVGSAHFLADAIEVLVNIYEKVWNKAKEIGLRKGLEIITSDEKGKVKKINLLEIADEDRFKLCVKFFIILSKNIYGVDINPSALKVAKARLFLTLAKHFKVGKDKDIFIRFPNVHFNLREGNSLIGYVELKKEVKTEQLTIFDFGVKEEHVDYIIDRIKIVAELKDYLENTAKSLNLDGNIAKEIKELNKILSKRKIDYEDFEKILRTKEKLITILIATLNSKYAKPLNDFLGNITDLFNKKLDEMFAEEYDIDLSELREIKTFHWLFEFPEVFLNGNGFDVVIGNPPYVMEVRDNKDLFRIYKESPLGKKYYEQKMDLFYFFIERGIDLLKNKGLFGFIVQEYWLNREHAKKLRSKVFSETTPVEFILFKEFNIFKDAPGQHNMILILKKGKEKSSTTIKILRNLRDESVVYSYVDSNTANEVFEVFKQDAGEIYDEKTDTVELIGGLKGEIWNKVHEGCVNFQSKEIQIGADVHQAFVTNKHLQKIGDYQFNLGEGIFILSEEEYKSYNWTEHELRVLKPFFFAEEMDKFYFPLKNRYWLIYTDRKTKEDVERHPNKYLNIRKHLDRFQEIITSDNKPYGLHRPRQSHWFESRNKIVGVRKTKYPKFVVVPMPFYTDQATIIIIPKKQYGVGSHYFEALLNSTLGHWLYFNLKTQGRQLQIDKGVVLKFPLKINVEFRFLEILSKYIHFLKQYQNYFARKDRHLQYVIDYFDNLIDCFVYELYLGDVVKIPIKRFAEDKLEDIELPDNLLEASEKEREKTLEKIKNVFQKLENDKKLNENLYLIKLHPWVKAIYTSLER